MPPARFVGTEPDTIKQCCRYPGSAGGLARPKSLLVRDNPSPLARPVLPAGIPLAKFSEIGSAKQNTKQRVLSPVTSDRRNWRSKRGRPERRQGTQEGHKLVTLAASNLAAADAVTIDLVDPLYLDAEGRRLGGAHDDTPFHPSDCHPGLAGGQDRDPYTPNA
jgi:hypothetical protein